MVISENYVITPNTTKIVFEYQTRDREAIFEEGFYKFLGVPDIQCKVNFYLDNKPQRLWLDHPVKVSDKIKSNSKLKIEIINQSADTHLINVSLHIREKI